MKKYINKNKQFFNIILIVMLYFFSFILTKQIVNFNVQRDFGDIYVLPIYSLCIIFTSIGYFLFYCVNRTSDNYKKNNFIVGLILLPSSFINILSTNNVISIIMFIISSMCYGYIGSYICFFVSKKFKTINNKGMLLGVSISLAAFLQVLLVFVTQNVYVLFSIMYICIIVCFCLCGIEERKTDNFITNDRRFFNKKKKIIAILVTILLSIIVGIQDGLAVRFDAFGHVQIYSFLKLSYVFGSILSGILFDFKNGKYYGLVTICIAFVTIISLFFIKNPDAFNYNIWCLYFCTGYYIVYSIMIFIEIAYNTDKPKLWASIGRLIGCLTIGITILPANYLYDKMGSDFIIIFSLLLMVPALILFYFDISLVFKEEHYMMELLNTDRNIISFMNNYLFTTKEKQICKMMLENQLQIKEIAYELKISSRSVQRHLTSIYQKTNTNSKIELYNLFYKQQ